MAFQTQTKPWQLLEERGSDMDTALWQAKSPAWFKRLRSVALMRNRFTRDSVMQEIAWGTAM